jgi:hypothetical protein
MKRLLLLASLAALGCEGLTSTPRPIVSVLRLTSDDCFALMTPNAPVAAELGVPAICSETTPPRLFGGDDLVEVVIDYGPDVDFAGSDHSPPPTVTVSVDGAVVDLAIDLSHEHRILGRAYYIATFVVPDQPSIDMQIIAGVNAQFQTTVQTVFSIVIPPVSLDLLECPLGQQCILTGATGSAHVHVSVTGTIPQMVTVHTKLDGVPLPDSLPTVITEVAHGHTEHTTAILVPAAHDGAQWLISAQLGAQPPTTVIATIHKPTITTALSCGSTCALHTGDSVGLTITAPAQITPLQAFVDTSINGVPQLVAAPVTLRANADGTATGILTLHAPATTGQWQIDASVAGYPADALLTTIQ